MPCNLFSVHVFTYTNAHAIYYADNSNDYHDRTQEVSFASFSHSNCHVTCPCALCINGHEI